MKWYYLLLLLVVSLIVNAFSVYNVFLAIGSIFLILIVAVTQIFVTVVNRARKADRQTFAIQNLANYGTTSTSRAMNKFAIVFGLIVVYVMGIIFSLLQLSKRDDFSSFLIQYLDKKLVLIPQILSVIGYVLFASGLIGVTLFCMRAMKQEAIFKG